MLDATADPSCVPAQARTKKWGRHDLVVEFGDLLDEIFVTRAA
jgi:hypothetical protein